MRITTYTTRIKDNLNVLVKERAFNYKTENSHLDSAEKIAQEKGISEEEAYYEAVLIYKDAYEKEKE